MKQLCKCTCILLEKKRVRGLSPRGKTRDRGGMVRKTEREVFLTKPPQPRVFQGGERPSMSVFPDLQSDTLQINCLFS